MTVLDSARQQKAKEYARIERRLWVVSTVFGLLYALVWLFSGSAVQLRQALLEWLRRGDLSPTAADWALVALFALVYGGIAATLAFPLQYYKGFVLPKRYDLSTQTRKAWLMDRLKELAIGTPLSLLLLELLYLALRLTGERWWLWAAAFLLLFNVLLSNLAPVLLLPLFNKFVPLEAEHADLVERLMRLAERSGARVRGVFQYDASRRSRAASAFLAGLGNTRRIVVSDTLLKEFSADEIETVLAHELGHHVHHDIPLLILFGTLLTTGSLFLASRALLWTSDFFWFHLSWLTTRLVSRKRWNISFRMAAVRLPS